MLQTPPLGTHRPRWGFPHIPNGTGAALIPLVSPRLPRHNIVRFASLAHGFVSGDLVRTSQGVTHPATTPTQARLTAEFQEPAMRVAPKRIVFRKVKIYL